MKEDLVRRLTELQSEREAKGKAIIKLLGQVGVDLLNSGAIVGMEIFSEHDVHAFLRSSSNPYRVLHVQVYPGMSDADNIAIHIREMDYQKLMEIRARSVTGYGFVGPSIGNEHEAVTRLIRRTLVPNSPESLLEALRDELTLPQPVGKS